MIQYDFSSKALFRPTQCPVFVGYDPNRQFEIEELGLSLVNAWWLSNASHLAYYNGDQVEKELGNVGLSLVEFFDHDATQGFLAAGDGFAILAFRGTQVKEFRDALTNIKITLVPFGNGARVHEGFLQSLDKVWQHVEAKLKEMETQDRRVWYTGHSLGAALATIAAARKKPAALFTFGSPTVGDKEFAHILDEISVQRFVNCTDIVTTVPPGAFGYQHAGDQYFITAKGKIIKNQGRWSVLGHKVSGIVRYASMLPWFRRGMVKLRSLADHAIVNYTAAMWNGVERTSEP